mgnify:CR=1 FL=1
MLRTRPSPIAGLVAPARARDRLKLILVAAVVFVSLGAARNLGIRGPAIPGTDNLLGTGISIPAFGLILKALATSDDTDVLSTPHILATDNVPAEINIGENIPLNTNVGIPGLSSIPGAAGAARW